MAPRIPSVGDGGLGPASRPDTRVPRRVNTYRPIVPEPSGLTLGVVGEGLRQFARDGLKALAEADKLEVSAAQAAFSRSKVEIDALFSQDQDAATIEDRYADALQAAKEAALEGVAPRYRDAFAAKLDLDVARGRADIQKRAFGLHRDSALAGLAQNMAANREAALTAEDPADQRNLVASTMIAISGAQERGFLTEVEADDLRRKWRQDFRLAHLGMQKPEDQVRLIAEDESLQRAVPADKLAKIKATALKVIEDENRERAAYVVSDLEIAVNRGEKGVEAIEDAYHSGWLTPAKRTALTKKADELTKKRADEHEEMGRVNVAVTMGLPLDPGNKQDRKAVDLHFKQVFAPALSEIEPEKQAEAILGYVRDSGIVPSPLKDQWTATLRGGDAQAKAGTADVMARLQEMNPRLLENFDGTDRRLATAIAANLRIGMDPAKAVHMAEEAIHQADDPARQVREKQIRDEKLLANAGTVVADALAEPDFFSLDFGDAKVPDAVVGEYRAAFEAHFLATGDAGAAKDLALGDLKQTWAVTRVGGERRLMKFAPEAVYGLPGLSPQANAEWMADQLEADLKRMGLPTEGVRIEADPITARSKTPSYVVLREREDGVIETLTQGVSPMRWRPDWSKSPRRAALQAEIEEGVEAAKNQRRRLSEDAASVDVLGLGGP